MIDCPKVNNVEFDNFLLFSALILSTGNNSVICQTKGTESAWERTLICIEACEISKVFQKKTYVKL